MSRYGETRYFNPTQMEWHKNRLNGLKARLKVFELGGTDPFTKRALRLGAIMGQSTEDLEKEIRRLEFAIKKHTPPKRTAKVKDKMYIQARKLLGEIMAGMPSKDEMWGMTYEGGRSKQVDNYEFSVTVNKHRKWEERNLEKIKKFRNIMRQLDMNHPFVGSTAFIRRCKNVDDFFKKIQQN